jgi:hypothetical protein
MEGQRPDGRKARQEAPVREPGIEELGDALAKGASGKADIVLGRVDAHRRRRSDSPSS